MSADAGAGERGARRARILEIFAAALATAAPAAAIERHLAAHPELVQAIERGPGEVIVVGAGKAAAAMAAALHARFGPRIAGGQVIVRRGADLSAATGRIDVAEAGHPIPDADGVAASARLLERLRGRRPEDLVIAAISGGASALLQAPPPGVALADLQALTRALLASGAPIAALNAVRSRLCRLKGGGLAALAAPARVHALVISDVIGDDPAVIGSGPTVADRGRVADAITFLKRQGLWDRSLGTVQKFLEGTAAAEREGIAAAPPGPARATTAVIVGLAEVAAAAAQEARAGGHDARVLTPALAGEAREVGELLAALAAGLRGPDPALRRPAIWVLAGETTVTLPRGDRDGERAGRVGVGGRNLECALAAALALDGREGVSVACLASDGSDGSSGAAGAIVDGTTAARARAAGLDPARALAEHDAGPLLTAIGDAVITGPTGTNVADLALVVVE
ncbi:MAG: DUF4147 domain-containing protein [Nannocystaceae bacterium]